MILYHDNLALTRHDGGGFVNPANLGKHARASA